MFLSHPSTQNTPRGRCGRDRIAVVFTIQEFGVRKSFVKEVK